MLATSSVRVDPDVLGIGAGVAAERMLEATGLSADSLDFVEFNEAFASQTLASLDQLGIDAARANLHGGALALGHAYGAVLVTRLLFQARRTGVHGRLALALISSTAECVRQRPTITSLRDQPKGSLYPCYSVNVFEEVLDHGVLWLPYCRGQLVCSCKGAM